MKTTEMVADIIKCYSKFTHLFEMAGIKEQTFLNWLHKFKSHSEVRLINTFIFGGDKKISKFCLLFRLEVVQQKIDQADATDKVVFWKRMRSLAKDDNDVILLNQLLQDLRVTWSGRPKLRRGTE